MIVMLMLLIAAGLSAGAGIAVTTAILPLRRANGYRTVTLVFGLLLGAWISSVTFLLSLLVGHGSLITAIGVDAFAFVAAMVLYVTTRHLHVVPLSELNDRQPDRFTSLIWLLPLLGAFYYMLQTSMSFAEVYPFGRWDAWSNWNLKARYFHLGGERWQDVFSPLMTGHWHDYPLWLPLSLARWWTYAGTPDPWVGQLLSIAALTMVALLMFTGLRAMRGLTHACIATIVLLTSEATLRWGGAQYADIPLSMFMLGSLIAVSLGLCDARRTPAWWVLAGLLAGAAVCTKHEGKLFCLVLIFTASLATWATVGLKPAGKRIGLLVLAMLPGAAITLGFNAMIGAEAAQFYGGSTWAMLTDPARHRMTLQAIADIAPQVFDWRVLLLVPVYGVLAGLNRRRPQCAAAAMCIVASLLLAAGYYATLITTRLDLVTHVTTSVDRLMVQLWPMFLLGVFLLLRAPEEMGDTSRAPAEETP